MSALEAGTPATSDQIIHNWMKEHWLQIGILVSFLLFSLSAAYYFLIYMPTEGIAPGTFPNTLDNSNNPPMRGPTIDPNTGHPINYANYLNSPNAQPLNTTDPYNGFPSTNPANY